MKFILIEPNTEMRELLTVMLERAVGSGHTILTLEDIFGATDVVPELHRDASVVFVARGGAEEGVIAAHYIKEMTPACKVVLTSTLSGLEMQARVEGLDGFIVKGDFFPPEKLREFIEKNLGVKL